MFESLNLPELFKRQCGILREPSGTRPRVFIVEEDGTRAVVKEFTSNGFFFRNIIGRFLIWREKKTYRKIQGLKGVPKLYRVINGLAIVIEEIQGQPLEKVKDKDLLPNEFIDTLKGLIDKIHRKGIAHCDLKRAGNIILGDDGMPYIIDWGASISENEFKLPFLNAIYQRFILDDNMAIIKLRLRYAHDTVTKEELRRYNYRSTAEKTIRKIRDKLRHTLQRIA